MSEEEEDTVGDDSQSMQVLHAKGKLTNIYMTLNHGECHLFIRPNKINILFPVTCWKKRGSDGRGKKM